MNDTVQSFPFDSPLQSWINMRIIIVLISILFPLGLLAQDDVMKGFSILDEGRYDEAYTYFTALEKENPDNVSIQIGYGRAMGLSGLAEEANLYFKQKLETDSNNVELQLNYAESMLWAKKTLEAKSYYEELIVRHPQNFVPYIGLGNAHSILRQYDEAMIQYKKAKELNPDLAYIDVQMNYADIGKAYLFLENGKFNSTVAVFERMLEKDSTSADAHLGLANVAFALTDFKEVDHRLDIISMDSTKKAMTSTLDTRLDRELSTQVTTTYKFLFDNNDNVQNSLNVGVRMPVSFRAAILLDYTRFDAKNEFIPERATIRYLKGGINFRTRRFDFMAMAGPSYGKWETEKGKDAFVLDSHLKYKAEGNHEFKLFANKKVYDYTTTLVNKEITYTDIGLEYSGKPIGNIGVFGQYIHTMYSDTNNRNLALLSLYTLLKQKPVLKTGINLHYITFEQEVPLDYYSPSKLFIAEAFFEWNSMADDSKDFGARIELVPGLIKENNTQFRTSYRGTAEMAYRPNTFIWFHARVTTGSYAAIESEGYNYWSIEAGFKCFFKSKIKNRASKMPAEFQ